MNKIEKTCKECNCKYFIVWSFGFGSFGFGDMYSCKLQGQSVHIESVAKDCQFKEQLKKVEDTNRK